jgi:hypothetical protein
VKVDTFAANELVAEGDDFTFSKVFPVNRKVTLSPATSWAVALFLINVIKLPEPPEAGDVMLLASRISLHILSKASFPSSKRVF